MGSKRSLAFVAFLLSAMVAVSAVPCLGQAPQTAAKASAAPEVKADPWAPLSFLVGRWTGVGSGKPGEAISGGTTFELRLDGKVLLRDNRAEYAAAEPGKPNVVHSDLMVIYPDGGGFRADYFDSEGHVIHYAVSFPEPGKAVVFETDPGGKGPRFRLVYGAAPDGSLTVDFLIAPPGGEFKSYVKGALKRAA